VFLDLAGRHYIDNFHFHNITAAQLAVDGPIEECEIVVVRRAKYALMQASKPTMQWGSSSNVATSAIRLIILQNTSCPCRYQRQPTTTHQRSLGFWRWITGPFADVPEMSAIGL